MHFFETVRKHTRGIEMKEPSSADIASLLAPYYPVEDQGLIEHIRAYIPLLLAWNGKISLTKITDPVEIVKISFRREPGRCVGV